MGGKEIKTGQEFNLVKESGINKAFKEYRDHYVKAIATRVTLTDLMETESIRLSGEKSFRLCMSLSGEELNKIEAGETQEGLRIPFSIKDYLAKEYFNSAVVGISAIAFCRSSVYMQTYCFLGKPVVIRNFIAFNLKRGVSNKHRYEYPIDQQEFRPINANIIRAFSQMITNEKSVADVLDGKGKAGVVLE